MSLITLIHVPDGVVMACDTRTTIRTNTSVRYKDDTYKIIPFPDRILVGHVGSNNIKSDQTVESYLIRTRKYYQNNPNIRPEQFPLELFDDIVRFEPINNTEYIVVCLDRMEDDICKVYHISQKDRCMYCDMFNKQYDALNYGLTDIANPMTSSQNIQYNYLSLHEAVELACSTVKATIDAYSCRNAQSVGGKVLCYVMSNSKNMYGWVENGSITIEENADPMCFEKKLANERDKIEQLIRNRNPGK